MPNIDELKYLSLRRLEAADILNNNCIHDIAYQDSGYIVELGLKAVICNHLDEMNYPDQGEENRIYKTHHFDSLVHLAGLTEELARKKATDRKFMKNWSIATKWSVNLRYKPIGPNEESISTAFINAIKTEQGGVLPWIKQYW